MSTCKLRERDISERLVMTKICLTLPVEVIDDWNLILRQDECTIYSTLIDSFCGAFLSVGRKSRRI